MCLSGIVVPTCLVISLDCFGLKRTGENDNGVKLIVLAAIAPV